MIECLTMRIMFLNNNKFHYFNPMFNCFIIYIMLNSICNTDKDSMFMAKRSLLNPPNLPIPVIHLIFPIL